MEEERLHDPPSGFRLPVPTAKCGIPGESSLSYEIVVGMHVSLPFQRLRRVQVTGCPAFSIAAELLFFELQAKHFALSHGRVAVVVNGLSPPFAWLVPK